MMSEFAEILEKWYSQHGRFDLPWRGISDPYKIWISEIILQQTRVAQGMDYYLRFVDHFPDVESLAAAEEDEVLKMWQGLGYYSRARNLHAAAKAIVAQGGFPTDYEGVRALKGIGDYTAAAICSFAFQLPYPVVDGNVYRVLSRIYGIDTPIDSKEGKKQFTALAEDLIDRDHPDIYNSAIMDFGATQCTPQQPDCLFCPYAEKCEARMTGRVMELPVKAKKIEVKERYFVYVYIEDETRLLLHRRPEGDIWQGLYEPYLIEFDQAPTERNVQKHLIELARQLGASSNEFVLVAQGMKHILTHRKLHIDCYRLQMKHLPDNLFSTVPENATVSSVKLEDCICIRKSDRNQYATPKIVTDLFAKL